MHHLRRQTDGMDLRNSNALWMNLSFRTFSHYYLRIYVNVCAAYQSRSRRHLDPDAFGVLQAYLQALPTCLPRGPHSPSSEAPYCANWQHCLSREHGRSATGLSALYAGGRHCAGSRLEPV